MTKIDPASGLDRAAMEFAWKAADRALLEFAPDMGPIVRTAIVTGACTAAIKAYVEAMSGQAKQEAPPSRISKRGLEAYRLWYRTHTGKMITRATAERAILSYLSVAFPESSK